MPLDYANPEKAASQHEMSSKFFIAALVGNISTHLFFLLMNTVKKTIIYCKQRAYKREAGTKVQTLLKQLTPLEVI